MKKYLLPCECGQKIEVDAGQAGLAVTCACGKAIEVPTMRGLSALATVEGPVAADKAAVPPAWGPGQGLMFLGAVITLCGIIALALVLPTRPQWTVQKEQIRTHVEHLTPAQLLERWAELRKGLTAADDPERRAYEAHWSTYRRHLTMAAIPLALGVVLLIAGFALRSKAPRRSPA